MDRLAPPPALHHRLIGPLYVEALLLADEARLYFESMGKGERERLDPVTRVAFSCESLKLTTRLMHVTAWLLAQRAGQPDGSEERPLRSARLGAAPESDQDVLAPLPETARALVEASIDLHDRVARLDEQRGDERASPARTMLDRLSASF